MRRNRMNQPLQPEWVRQIVGVAYRQDEAVGAEMRVLSPGLADCSSVRYMLGRLVSVKLVDRGRDWRSRHYTSKHARRPSLLSHVNELFQACYCNWPAGTFSGLMMLTGLLSSVQVPAIAQEPTVTPSNQIEQTSDTPKDNIIDRAKDARTMHVQVVNSDGKPIANADLLVSIWEVEKSGNFPTTTYQTDNDGGVNVRLPQNVEILRIWPSKKGYVSQFLNLSKRDHDGAVRVPGSFTFFLQKGEPLGGTVIDSEGRPIAGASVQVSVEVFEPPLTFTPEPMISTWIAVEESAAITNQDGRWEVFNAPAKKNDRDYKFQLQVTHPDFAGDTKWGDLQAKQGVTTEQLRTGKAQIKLEPGLRIRGKITRPDGQPITKGFVVWDDYPYLAEGDNEVAIDESGNYRSLPLSPGRYPVTVLAPGFAPQQVNFELDTSSKGLDFQLKLGNHLQFEIVDTNGSPVPNAYVDIGEWRGTNAIYNNKHPNVPDSGIPPKSDSRGLYTWAWAPEDAVVYRIGKEGFVNTEVALVASEKTHRIELSPMMKIYGKVTDIKSGKPIERFSVVPVIAFRQDIYATSFYYRIHAKDGSFEIPIDSHGQSGNRYLVRIEADGYRTAFSTKSIKVGDSPLREDFSLEPAAAIEGKVVNPDGSRALDFMVAVGTPTSPQSFSIDRVPVNFGIEMKVPGTDRFQIPASFEPQLVRVFNDLGFSEIHLPVDGELGTIRLRPWAKVTGCLLQGDKPIANEGVYFRPLVQPELSEARFQDSFYTQTDHMGNFEFDRLPPMAGRIQADLGPWEDSQLSSSQSIAINLQPAESMSLRLGGDGGRVVGKVVATGRDNDSFNKQWSLNYLISRKPGLPLLENVDTSKIKLDQVFNKSWVTSDDFNSWLGTKDHYFVKLNEDGLLKIDGVSAGQYDLVIQLYEQPVGCLVETIGQAIIPITIEDMTDGSSAKDLGEITVECRSGPRVGADMRAFTFIDSDQRVRNVGEMSGRYVLFHAWATWCAPCIAYIPELKSATAHYHDQPLTVVGLNIDGVDQQPKARAMAQVNQWDWAMNYLGNDSVMMRQLAVSSVPVYYLVGPDGKLLMSSNQWPDVKKALVEELAH